MKKKVINIFTMMFLICSLTIVSGVTAFASPTNSYDNFLRAKGVPENVLEQMPEKQKELIFQTLGENATFESYEKYDFYGDDSALKYNLLRKLFLIQKSPYLSLLLSNPAKALMSM